jgi:hypothetical protein
MGYRRRRFSLIRRGTCPFLCLADCQPGALLYWPQAQRGTVVL